MKPQLVDKFFKDRGFRVQVRHFHEKEHLPEEARYCTTVRVTDESGTLVTHGTATCAPNDQPIRRVGYSKAMGRAYAEYIHSRPQGA